ncbi:biotin/lipoyl-binding protein [Nannocystis pusilla]|uniref:efflux RND transporter periplasmic adaptor subunit n=1 Tax=Nannocystis pusilla TaxID=889268 RepID=UPI003B76E77C
MHLSRLLLGAALFLPFACDSGDQPKIGLPPARAADGADAPKVPGPPPRPEQGVAAGPAVASAAGRYVSTALPKHSADLSPRMSGTLVDVMVEEGERVKKGQLLFRLDARASRLGIAQAETSLQAATISRDNAERELERQRKLAQSGSISPPCSSGPSTPSPRRATASPRPRSPCRWPSATAATRPSPPRSTASSPRSSRTSASR